MLKLIARFAGIFLAVISLHSVAVDIPKSLEEWKPWVLEKYPDINCPFLFNNAARTCSWPSELHIDANKNGATFSQHIEVYKNDWVAIPGNVRLWPQNVSDSNTKIAVRDNNNIPEIYLTVGTHQITGEIRWNEMPRTLPISEQTGIVQLTLNGKSVITPSIENNNQLWLTASDEQSNAIHQDTFTVHVFRKVEDTIPLRIITLIKLDVSGKEREVQLGQFLLTGFTPIGFTSALPARIEKDGNLRIQVKPGSWEITLISQTSTPLNNFTFKANSEDWPQQEIWVFTAERHLRSVQISGVQTIDPQQTQLPEEWKTLPAYLVTPETHFTIEELQRGENKETSGKLTLNRSAWLSFDGEKFIQRDNIQGQLQRTRIETIQPYELTSAEIDGKAQLITHLENSKNTGMELRNHDITITGIGQITRNLTLPVSGWSEDFNSVTTQLYLPPGWSLLTATGTSNEWNSWISEWSLWDIFLVLIIAVAIARTIKPVYGLLAAITLIVIYQREGAPVFIWLNLIAAITLCAFVSGAFKKYIIRYTYISFLLLALITLPFATKEARAIINPSLEHDYFFNISSYLLPSYSSDKKKPSSRVVDSVSAPAPMAADMAAEAESDAIAGSYMSKRSLLQKSQSSYISDDYNPNQQTQTGLAIPEWSKNSAQLFWTGPVKANETTKVFLISPLLNRIGYFLSVILPLLLAGVLLRHFFNSTNQSFTLPTFDNVKKSTVLPSILSGLLLAGLWLPHSQSANADVVIDQNILNELEARLTKPPQCLPSCAAIESVNVNLKQDQLILDLVVHSSDLIALPLPADHTQWWPHEITVDGKNATLVQTNAQTLLVSLPKGRHNISIKANLQNRDSLNLAFPLPLHNVVSTANGWEISGIPNSGQESQSLQLQRVEHNETVTTSEHLRPDPIAPFVIIRRELTLDLEWTLTTTVTRVAPAFNGFNIEVPLLEGEAPLTTQVNNNGKITVHLEANQDAFSWSSNIKQHSPLQLQAAQNTPWVEIWVLDVSSIWHTETKGIAPIQLAQYKNLPIWQPWPGESLQIDITRPDATKGNYVTVDSSQLTYKLGNRTSTSELILNIRANQGDQYNFTLPKNATLSSVRMDGDQIPMSAVNGLLKIPLHPGKQHVEITWSTEESVGTVSKSPVFNVEQGSSNQRIIIELPHNRWALFAGGPLIGPSLLLWGMLIIVVIIAVILGRSKITPLKSYEWVLLSLGVCTINFFTFTMVAVWLIALRQRGKLQTVSTVTTFKILQVVLFIFSIITLATLIGTIPAGLLGSPDMHVAGNDSYGNVFKWYQDHSDSAFPTAWVISLPLWTYKVTILLWALWLASALINWIRWGWQQLNYHALWYAPTEIVMHPTPTKVAAQKKSTTPDDNNKPTI